MMTDKLTYSLMRTILTVSAFLLLLSAANAQKKDSVNGKPLKMPKHYFMPTVFGNFYSVGKRTLNNNKPVGALLKDFKYSQTNTGFYLPLFTKDKLKKDSTTIANWHVLLTGNFLSSRPVFSGLKTQHVFSKYSIGLRTMYNTEKKDVFFFDVSPFAVSDNQDTAKPVFRSASTFVWSRIVSEKFSFRIGFTRTFIFGDRLSLPYVGLRFGALDKTYFSIQFPRNMFLNVPIVRSLSFNLLVKPNGGIYTFHDKDSLYNGVNKQLIFGRRDYCFGLGLDFHPSRFFSMYLHAGSVSANSGIAFFSQSYNNNNQIGSFSYFYLQKLKRSSYIEFGLTLRFGKSKNAYGNKNIYELQNLNAAIDPGDNNMGPNNPGITPSGKIKQLNKLKFKDLSDLIDNSDLYN